MTEKHRGYKVEFLNVGRHKKSWSTTMHRVTFTACLSEIRRNQALLSNEVEIGISEDQSEGYIVVCGRQVGRMKISKIKEGQ